MTQEVSLIALNQKDYPNNLRKLAGAPKAIWVKGSIKVLNSLCCAIVGSRKMTPYGQEVARSISFDLAAKGVTIVSGLARGVDTEAHKATLSAGGRTIAVLGCGLDRIYPPENSGLAKEIIEKGGALVSEYPLGYPISASNFAARNRIISGLSGAVIVVEGAAKSGTLLTASAAADQGRTVFAVPGPITAPLSVAPLFLLQNGARIFTTTQEVFDELKYPL
jgi:DNA processing protein